MMMMMMYIRNFFNDA